MKTKLTPFVCVLLVVLLTPTKSDAGIIGVLTESNATGTFRDDADGNPITVSYSGPQINEAFEGAGFGSAAFFESTSLINDDVIEFKNGNASYGEQVHSVSRTVVDISFKNTGTSAVRPTLNSQITPAGLGIYVSGCGGVDIRTCELRDDGDYDWQDVGREVAAGEAAVGTRFDFKVVSGEDVLFSLSGGLSLVIGEDGNLNTIVQDFGEVENVLTNFRQTSPFGTEQQISFDWDATDFSVEFPEYLTLDPGDTGTLSYITEVTTFSNAFCYDTGRQACPVAYGAFGDPIGRGGTGGTLPPDRADAFIESQQFAQSLFTPQVTPDSGIMGIDVGLYQFNIPTFENGQIGYRAINGPGLDRRQPISEPISMLLLLLGLWQLYMRRNIKRF